MSDGQTPAVGSRLGTLKGLFNDLFETKNIFIIVKEGRIHLFYKFYLWLFLLENTWIYNRKDTGIHITIYANYSHFLNLSVHYVQPTFKHFKMEHIHVSTMIFISPFNSVAREKINTQMYREISCSWYELQEETLPFFFL